ncbi:hypothetical protein FGO68_gene10972 [Halteria grandinella]|uniref:Uncharacterized protein n=1 Tax=Halteria grandinella TaxID=5974 RepID=A0A8J8T8W0_HALGN|nr:hypothetical protein FGO68_gene10972 [Halteria grandinella]
MPLVEGINTYSTIGRYWIPITLTKWTILIVALITLREYPALQIIIIAPLLIFSQALMIVGKPLDSKMENIVSLFNEIMASLYLYGLFTLTDSMGKNQIKEECGFALLVLVIFTISLNIIKVMLHLVSYINCKNIKKKFSKKLKDQVIQLKPMQTNQSDFQVIKNQTFDGLFKMPDFENLQHDQIQRKVIISIAPVNSIDRLAKLYQNQRVIRY